MEKRLKVKNDFIFRRIFGQKENKEILISFLNAILELEGKKTLDDLDILEDTKNTILCFTFGKMGVRIIN